MKQAVLPGFCECGCGDITTIARRDRASGVRKGEPSRFVSAHNRPSERPVRERLLDRLAITDTGCWVWQGAKTPDGYGKIWHNRRLALAHRVAYLEFVGEVPPDRQLDHLCRNRACVNPAHLEPVTLLENVRRGNGNASKTHCPQGHPYSGDNVAYFATTGGGRARHCRACARERSRRRRQAQSPTEGNVCESS